MSFDSFIRGCGLAAALGFLGAAGQAQAILVVSVSGIESRAGLNSPVNVTQEIDTFPGGVLVDVVSWDLGLSTFDGSWLSEATILIRNSAGAGVAFNPGFGSDFSGAANFAGSISLVTLGTPFTVLPDGKLSLQFYDSFDDVVGGADALYTRGSITFPALAAVPEPEMISLMLLGVLGVAGAVRRRHRAHDQIALHPMANPLST